MAAASDVHALNAHAADAPPAEQLAHRIRLLAHCAAAIVGHGIAARARLRFQKLKGADRASCRAQCGVRRRTPFISASFGTRQSKMDKRLAQPGQVRRFPITRWRGAPLEAFENEPCREGGRAIDIGRRATQHRRADLLGDADAGASKIIGVDAAAHAHRRSHLPAFAAPLGTPPSFPAYPAARADAAHRWAGPPSGCLPR
jgi:hypothetical protein